jgi:hypothetical protein
LSRDANLTLTARSGGAVPDGAVPDGAVPDGAVPDGAVPDGAVPDGAVPDGAVPDAMAALRALCAAAWRRAAADGRDAGRIGPVRGADAPAVVVLTSLGLAGPA